MSIPISHHYVSRCQIDCFFNRDEGKIYYYDKEKGFIGHKLSSKTLFSEEDANTRVINHGDIDRISLERDLQINFEDHYHECLSVIKSSIESAPNAHPDFDMAVEFFTRFGIIGDVRNPAHKSEIDSVINNFYYNIILPHAAPKLRREIETHQQLMSRVKYSNVVLYSRFADKVYKSMGGVRSMLNVTIGNRYFLLPDRSSIRKRAKINKYFNPDIEEIAMVGIPIHSRLFLHTESIKLNKLQKDVLFPISPYQGIGEVERINYALFKNAYNRVACESKEYLQWFINNLDEIGKRFYS